MTNGNGDDTRFQNAANIQIPIIDALESGNDNDATVFQIGRDAFVIDRFYARFVMRAIGRNLYLPAGIGAGPIAAPFERHRQQRYRDLLSGRQQHVQFTSLRLGIDLLRKLYQAVGFAAHGGHDDDHVVALVFI